MCKAWIIGGALLVSALCSLPMRADVERFPYTYGWLTPSKGEYEVELSHTQPTSGHNWQDQVSAEIGVTDRYMIEPYVVFNRSGGFRDIPTSGATDSDGDTDEGEEGTGNAVFDPILNGAAYRYGGFKVEQRYRFGNYGLKKLLAAGYLEYEDLRGEKPEIESKMILEYDPDRQANFAFNLIAETPTRQDGKTKWGYSLGGTYLADPKNDRYWLGAEVFGNWSEKQGWAGPSAGVYLDNQTRLVGTYGKQFQGSGGDQFKIMLSRELN